MHGYSLMSGDSRGKLEKRFCNELRIIMNSAGLLRNDVCFFFLRCTRVAISVKVKLCIWKTKLVNVYFLE